MSRIFRGATKHWRSFGHCYSTYGTATGTLPPTNTITKHLVDVGIQEFREIAFAPQRPLLIRSRRTGKDPSSEQDIPALVKWFPQCVPNQRESSTKSADGVTSSYLLPFSSTILPYELFVAEVDDHSSALEDTARPLFETLSKTTGLPAELKPGTFHTFDAPLGLFLQICRAEVPHPLLRRLYIAQARVFDLPIQLQQDLPPPKIVRAAGNGDIYDANLWMGFPPTYTPLHKDPNPNLFVQLAGSKRIRLFRPDTGAAVFRQVQERLGQHSPARFRGNEMMEGPERSGLDEAVWRQPMTNDGLEATVEAGDALFIPKGWWHSIKSCGTDLTASVNWWFR